MNSKTIKYSFMASLPVMAGYIVLGIGFGMMLASKGYSYWWALLMSVTIYAGSMQYVGVNLVASGASIISTAIMTIMVNARHIFYGISMLEKYKNTGKAKSYLIFALTDETYSLVCDRELPAGVSEKYYYLLVSGMNQCYWIIGSFIGAYVGNVFSLNLAGIDFSMTALFTVIVVEQWEKNKNHVPALLGAGTAIICLLVFGPDRFMIPTMLLITAGLLIFKKAMIGTSK